MTRRSLPPAYGQPAQQLPVPGVPPRAMHRSGVGAGLMRIILHRAAKQSVFAAQLLSPLANIPAVQVPVAVSHVPNTRQSVSALQLLRLAANVPSVHWPEVVSQVPNSWR